MALSESEVEQIRLQAKELLDKFSRALSEVKVKEGEEWNVERENFSREDGEGVKTKEEFRKIMLENAPNKNEDFIIAEKKKW